MLRSPSREKRNLFSAKSVVSRKKNAPKGFRRAQGKEEEREEREGGEGREGRRRGGRRGKGEGTGYLTSFRVLPLTVRKMYVPAPRAVRAVLRAGMGMTLRPAVS